MLKPRPLGLVVILLAAAALSGAVPVYAEACADESSRTVLTVDDLAAADVPLPATAEAATHLLVDLDSRVGRELDTHVVQIQRRQTAATVVRRAADRTTPGDGPLTRAGRDAHHLSTPPPAILS